jgi:hypothetical protein
LSVKEIAIAWFASPPVPLSLTLFALSLAFIEPAVVQ